MPRLTLPLVPGAFLPLAALAACDPSSGDKLDTLDSGNIACDRIHGATGVLMLEDGGDTFHFPTAAPDSAVDTTSTGGPLGDGVSWGAFFGGRWLTSEDSGCNWDDKGGKVPSTGDWDLVVTRDVLYAFDRASSAGATTRNGGDSWTATDSGEPFLGDVTVDPDMVGRLRGVQSRGVLTSEDDGTNWTLSASPPEASVLWGSVWAGGVDTVAAVSSTAVYLSVTGGASWTNITGSLTSESFTPARVAIHPDDADSIFVSGTDDDGGAIYWTGDGGTTWKQRALQRQVDLDGDAPLWPAPGYPEEVISAWATTEGDYGINLYRIDATGIHTVHVSSYWAVNDVSFRSDGAWIVAVSGVR
jgi:hypothetical protein